MIAPPVFDAAPPLCAAPPLAVSGVPANPLPEQPYSSADNNT
jgi:hypothetical protein